MYGPQSSCDGSPNSVVSATFAAPVRLSTIQVMRCQGGNNSTMLTLPAACRLPSHATLCTGPIHPADVQDRRMFKQQREAQKVVFEQSPL